MQGAVPDLSEYVHTTDPRLSDARTPTAHNHDERYLTGAEVGIALASKSDTGHTHSGYAASTHDHDSTYVKPADVQSTPQTINAQTGTAYTLQASDAGKLVTLTNAAAITLTVPGNVFTTGQRVDCLQGGAGAVTVVGSGVTLHPMPGMTLVSEGQHALFTILFESATVARVAGWMAPA